LADITVRLTYSVNTRTLTTDPKPLLVKQYDTLTFVSAQGPVQVQLRPASLFSAGEFHTGDAPIAVKQAAPFDFKCGVTIDGVTIGWPANESFGDHGDPLVPMTP
jgi:hypothetical protein